MKQIKVLVVDDKEIFREGVARLLDEQEQIEVVSKCPNDKEAIDKVKNTEPDVVLMSTNIRQADSMKAVRQISDSCPEVKVAMVADSKNEENLFLAIEAGATGYLCKDMEVDDFIKSIYLIASGKIVISPPLTRKLVNEFTTMRASKAEVGVGGTLSERELQVLKLLAKGDTNKDIAKALFITENTVKIHVKRILEKLQLRNRQQAAAYAVQKGIASEVIGTE